MLELDPTTDIVDILYSELTYYPLISLICSIISVVLGVIVVVVDIEKLGSEKDGPGWSVVGLMVAGGGVCFWFYSWERYMAGRSLIRELDAISNSSGARLSASSDNTNRSNGLPIAMQDFILQVYLVLVFYENFTGGDRRRPSFMGAIGEFWKQRKIKFTSKKKVENVYGQKSGTTPKMFKIQNY